MDPRDASASKKKKKKSDNADETHIVGESHKETFMAVFCIIFVNSKVGPGLIYRFAR